MRFKINKNIIILSLGFLFIFLGFASVQSYVTTFFSEQGKANVGFISLILIYLFFAIGNTFSALFISKYGEKKAIIIGSIFYSLYIFSLLTNSISLVYIFSALLGLAASLLWIGQSNYLIKISKETHYGRNSGVFNTIQLTGSAIGLIALGILIKTFSYKLPFLIYAIAPLIGFILLFGLKDLGIEYKQSNFKLIKKAMKNKTALRLSTIWFAFHFTFGLTIGIIPLQVKDVLGVTYVGILSSVFYIFPILFSYLVGYLSDIFGRKKAVLFIYLASILGLVLLYINDNVILLVLGVVFLALSSAIVKTINSPLIGDFTTNKNIGFLTALFFAVQHIGVVTSLILAKSMQNDIVYLISIFVIIASFIMIYPLFKLNFNEIKEKLSDEIK